MCGNKPPTRARCKSNLHSCSWVYKCVERELSIFLDLFFYQLLTAVYQTRAGTYERGELTSYHRSVEPWRANARLWAISVSCWRWLFVLAEINIVDLISTLIRFFNGNMIPNPPMLSKRFAPVQCCRSFTSAHRGRENSHCILRLYLALCTV